MAVFSQPMYSVFLTKPHYKVLEKWFRQYGDMFGYYNGDVPFVALKDLDFVEHVCVRNFQNFVDRGIIMAMDSKHPILGRSIMHESAPRWKSVRNSVAYGFSTTKLKLMLPSIKEKVDTFLKLLDEHADSGEEVNVLSKYEELSMECVTRSLFGLDEHFLGKPDHPLILVAKAAFRGNSKTRPLTVQEVVVNAATLFVAGFETMASALSYVTFALAKHPKIQEKVRKEAADAISASGSLDYEVVTRRLKYLSQVIDEALRRYPPAPTSITRQAKEDFVYNGTKFKAGTCFMIPQYHLHMEPRFWPNPEEFNPGRFSPENSSAQKKCAHVPFGIGPRNCVGRRMALLQLKYAVARLVLKYRFELGASQEVSSPIQVLVRSRIASALITLIALHWERMDKFCCPCLEALI
ncbi:cytochrome P450 6B1-like [Dermacentor andersoni]|uniref:cytochrome P450 6B1-like n=1 Tax=Dermacentor andersoni TaxID=34620 RepID=UPI003B3A0578